VTAGLPPAAEVVERALEAAKGSDGAVVIVEDASEAELRFALNTTTTNGLRRRRTVTVVTLREKDGGVAAGVVTRTGAADPEALVRASQAEADSAAPAEDASPLLGPDEAGEDPDFADGPVLDDLGALGAVVPGLGDAFARARDRQLVLAGFAEHWSVTSYLGTSTGVRRRYVQPTGKLELVARTADGSASSWAGIGTPDLGATEVGPIADRLATRLSWAERQVELPAGRYEVLLPPDAMADVTALMAYATGGREAEDGSTVFSAPGGKTRLGEVVARHPFDFRSDPAEPGLECAPFVVAHASGADVSVFDNGMPVDRTSWIRDGRLEQLRYHRAGAARSGVRPAAGADNVILELPGATATLDEMVARTEYGLLITCLWYIREVDPVTLLLTGLTRDGVYLVEKGEISGAVNNFRFNESPVDLLDRATEVGRTERALSREWNEYLNRTAMPPVRIPDFNMSSVSQAT
jgi:predicted Zn-dependent protease